MGVGPGQVAVEEVVAAVELADLSGQHGHLAGDVGDDIGPAGAGRAVRVVVDVEARDELVHGVPRRVVQPASEVSAVAEAVGHDGLGRAGGADRCDEPVHSGDYVGVRAAVAPAAP